MKVSSSVTAPLFPLERRVTFGNISHENPSFVHYTKQAGESIWKSVFYSANENNRESYCWDWDSMSAKFSNDYQRSNTFQIDDEESRIWWESGYSGWTKLEDDMIFCVDYKRGKKEKPYIVGYTLRIGN